MRGSIWIRALLVLALGLAGACGGGEVDNTALQQRLAYLENLAEVEWIEFDGGDVYVGFSERPPDLVSVINTAVVAGFSAHGKPVHIWAVDGGAPGWRPGDGPIFCEASARLGTVDKACM